MKNIQSYCAEKYQKKGLGLFKKSRYKEIEDSIYEVMNNDEKLYVTSLSFVQEPEYDEGENAGNISQYSLEDILDEYFCHISDFYENENREDSQTCYLEFASKDIKDIRRIRQLVGKHVYNREIEKDGETYIKLVIE